MFDIALEHRDQLLLFQLQVLPADSKSLRSAALAFVAHSCSLQEEKETLESLPIQSFVPSALPHRIFQET